MKVNIISINPITVIPILRYIVHFFIDNYKANVELIEIHVKNFNNYYDNIEHFKFNNIAEFNTYQDYRNQTTKFKIIKYLNIIQKIFSIYKSQGKQLIYTNDFQVLFFILWIRKFFPSKKRVLIYQEFELIELEKLNKINHILYAYVLKKANTIDLTIFSEINRLNYFNSTSTLNKNKAFVLPNTCKVVTPEKNNEKHKLFNQLPKDAFIVAHLGNVGGNQHYFTQFISAIEKLEPNKNIVFLFLGRQNEMTQKIIKQKKLTNLFFVDSIPHEELPQVYPYIDLGVILYKGTGLNYEFCAPNKLYELWSNGIPVIGHHLKGLTPLFNTKEKGILTNFDDISELAKTISEFQTKTNKSALIQIFKDNLSIDIHLKEFKQRIDSIIEL